MMYTKLCTDVSHVHEGPNTAKGDDVLDFVRIGDKVVSLEKIENEIKQILLARSTGLSQSEVAAKTGIDRTFISRLEGLGELRKGGAIAIVGFPISNCDEVRQLALEEGVEFTFLMNDEERWAYVKNRNGNDLLNEIMVLLSRLRDCQKVILIGSDKRLDILKGLFDRSTEVATIVIGRSPMTGDVQINISALREVIHKLKG